MPIRTPRGRSAAYRGLWQWPLRSPVRLVVTIIVVLVVASGLSFALSATKGTSGAPAAPQTGAAAPRTTVGLAPGAVASSPQPTALPPVAELTPTTLPLTQAPRAALDVASRWATAWLRPPAGTTNEQWLDGLRTTTTDEYLGVLSGVDPGNIPSTKVTGAAKAVRVAAHSVQVQVPTDALTLLVLVVDDGTGWRVAGYDKA
jgi:hypothetical protein